MSILDTFTIVACVICGREFSLRKASVRKTNICPSKACRAQHKREYTRARRHGTIPVQRWTKEMQTHKVVFDPSGEFPVGANLLAVNATLKVGHFPEGMILQRGGRQLRVEGIELYPQHLVTIGSAKR